jgi:predicted PurR-regulated permease PerM
MDRRAGQKEGRKGVKVKSLQYVVVALVALILLCAATYGIYQGKRWFNYRFGYQDQVRAEIAPLEQRVAKLEARVKELEARK